MEKSVPPPTEQLTTHLGDGGRAMLMTSEPSKESFTAQECPQGDKQRATFINDARTPLESTALSGLSGEGRTELQKPAFYAPESRLVMSQDTKGPAGTDRCGLQDDPDYFSPLSRQEPDVALEAHEVAGMFCAGQAGQCTGPPPRQWGGRLEASVAAMVSCCLKMSTV